MSRRSFRTSSPAASTSFNLSAGNYGTEMFSEAAYAPRFSSTHFRSMHTSISLALNFLSRCLVLQDSRQSALSTRGFLPVHLLDCRSRNVDERHVSRHARYPL